MVSFKSAKRGKTGIDRRTVLKSTAAGLTLMALPSTAVASLLEGSRPRRNSGDGTLGRYLCSQVHEKMAVDLDTIIEDPSIDGETTALALMQARCPGCGERIHPKNSAISAVIPQWQWEDKTGLEVLA